MICLKLSAKSIYGPLRVCAFHASLPRSDIRVNRCLRMLSRRGAEKAIGNGRVTINGRVAVMTDSVKATDEIRLDGEIVENWQHILVRDQENDLVNVPAAAFTNPKHLYIKYWKPVGVQCTADPSKPKNIIDFGKFRSLTPRVFTVGRLDSDTSGLILLTSDGTISNALLHPLAGKKKVYEVTANRIPSATALDALRQGVTISVAKGNGGEPYVTAPAIVIPDPQDPLKFQMTISEGKKRQIRQMLKAVYLRVHKLHRIYFGGITLDGLQEGQWAHLTDKEVSVLLEHVDSYRQLRAEMRRSADEADTECAEQ